jgi:hypothetical protein
MLSVLYAEWYLGCVTNNPFKLSVIMPNVIVLNVIMLNVIMLNVLMLNVLMLNGG